MYRLNELLKTIADDDIERVSWDYLCVGKMRAIRYRIIYDSIKIDDDDI